MENTQNTSEVVAENAQPEIPVLLPVVPSETAINLSELKLWNPPNSVANTPGKPVKAYCSLYQYLIKLVMDSNPSLF